VGCFNRVEVFSLDVLDESNFKELRIGYILDYNRDLGQPGYLGCPPATLTRDDLIGILMATHDQRLNDAVYFNGRSKLFEPIRLKHSPRLHRVRLDLVDR
jgi:hypothetical protein